MGLLSMIRRISTRRYLSNKYYTTGRPPSAQHSIYVSNFTDPYLNLTLEDWCASAFCFIHETPVRYTHTSRLFRHKAPDEPLLLIYRDEPCVVIGRNQNPWKEVNFEALRTRPGVPFIRRRSGGGTVYHARHFYRVVVLSTV